MKSVMIDKQVELEPIIDGIRGTRRGNYICIDVSGWHWLTPAQAKKLAQALMKMANKLNEKKK